MRPDHYTASRSFLRHNSQDHIEQFLGSGLEPDLLRKEVAWAPMPG